MTELSSEECDRLYRGRNANAKPPGELPFELLNHGIACRVDHTTLGEAALQCGPSFVYTLHVHPSHLFEARNLLTQWGVSTSNSPLAPWVGLQPHNRLLPGEWYLEANGKKVGSRSPY
jgi:hypothetical protein